MAKRHFQPADTYRLKTASAVQLSPDRRRFAFALVEIDRDKDRQLVVDLCRAPGCILRAASLHRRPR